MPTLQVTVDTDKNTMEVSVDGVAVSDAKYICVESYDRQVHFSVETHKRSDTGLHERTHLSAALKKLFGGK